MTHLVEFPKLGISFQVNTVAFSIGDFHVYWYGIIIALGFLLGLIYATRAAKKMNIDVNYLFDAIIVGLIGSIICARLYYVIFSTDPKFVNNPIEILKIHDGGMAIYGALIGALVFGGITAKLRKLKVSAVLDVASLGFLIGQAIGRWGNFVNQEAFGTATDLPWGMYSDNTARVVVGNVHPCFLYESILCLIGFILLHFFNSKYRRYDGQTFLLYIVWYGVCRFFIEGLRTDSLLISFLDIRVSQVVAASCVIVGIILLILFRHKTSLTGCGNAKIMEAIGLVEPVVDPDMGKSTIFGDLPEEDKDSIFTKDESAPEKDKSPSENEAKPEIPAKDEEDIPGNSGNDGNVVSEAKKSDADEREEAKK